MVQLQQQAVQEGLQPLTLAAVHGCWRVTRRLQDAVDPSPEARGSKRAREQAEQAGSRDLDSEVAPSSPAGGAQWLGARAGASLSPHPRSSSPSPPRPLQSATASFQAQTVSPLRGKGTAGRGRKGDKGRGEPGGGEEGVGARNVQGPRQQRLARAACWGQAWTLGCGREFLPSSSHQPCRPGFGPGTAAACLPQGRTCPGAPKQDFRSLPSDLAGL